MSYRLMVARRIGKDEFPTIEAADARARELGADAVVQVLVRRAYPRIFTEKERELVSSEVDLGEYASSHLCGDGLERDIAEAEIHEMPDEDLIMALVEHAVDPYSTDEEDMAEVEQLIREAVGRHALDKVEAAVSAWKTSL